MGRYTLEKVPEYQRAYLDDIDKACLEEGTDSLEERLKRRGIELNKLKISYRANHKLHSLQVVDEKYLFLKNIRTKEGKIDITDYRFVDKVRELLEEISWNYKLRDYIYNKSDLSSKVIEYIDKCLNEYNTFNFNRLLDHLSQYLQFRKLAVIVMEFNNKTKQEEIIDDPLDFEDTSIKEPIPIQTTLFDEEDEKDPDEKMFDEWEKDR